MQHINDRFADEVRLEERHRDIVLSGLFHVLTSGSERVRFAIVGGPSLVREDTLVRESVRPFFPLGSTFSSFITAPKRTRWTFGTSGGVDLAVAVNRRVSVVPQMRVHFISRVNPTSQDTGLNSFVLRPGVNVRVGF